MYLLTSYNLLGSERYFTVLVQKPVSTNQTRIFLVTIEKNEIKKSLNDMLLWRKRQLITKNLALNEKSLLCPKAMNNLMKMYNLSFTKTKLPISTIIVNPLWRFKTRNWLDFKQNFSKHFLRVWKNNLYFLTPKYFMKTQMTLKILFFTLVILAALFEAVGDIILKKWSIDGKNLTFFFGVFIYWLAIVLWAFSLKYEYLSKAISVVSVLNLIVVVLVGVFYFKEDLSLLNKIGILLGIISLILVEID